jgi:hypothetical protein
VVASTGLLTLDNAYSTSTFFSTISVLVDRPVGGLFDEAINYSVYI